MSPRTAVVDFWFDPVCPYSWTASRWLAEVAARRPLEVRHHVMSLYLLNEHRADVAPEYRRNVEQSRGPSRVAAAVVERCGEDALGAFYTAFGSLVFDVWRRPTSAEYHVAVRSALASLGLPPDLEDAMESDAYDATMRQSHDAGLAPRRRRGRHPDDPHRRQGLLRTRPQRDPARGRRRPRLRGSSPARGLPRVLRAEADAAAAARLHLSDPFREWARSERICGRRGLQWQAQP